MQLRGLRPHYQARETGNVRLACEVAKVGWSSHNRWLGEKRRPQVTPTRAVLLVGIVGCLVAATGCASIVDRLINRVEPDTISVTPRSRAFAPTRVSSRWSSLQ